MARITHRNDRMHRGLVPTAQLGSGSATSSTVLLGNQTWGSAPATGVTVQDEGSSLATAGTTLNFTGAGVTASGTGATKTINVPGSSSVTREIGVTFDGGGAAPTAGTTADVVVPATGTISAATMLADAAGSAVIDVWRDTYANAPPDVADTITASAKPTLSSAVKSRDATLTGWTTAVTAGDVVRFHLDSASTLTRVTLTLTYS